MTGLEPATNRLQICCATICATPAYLVPPAGVEPAQTWIFSPVLYQLSYRGIYGADGRNRTRNVLTTKQALYQLNYISIFGASGQNRTGDTRIFSPVLLPAELQRHIGRSVETRTRSCMLPKHVVYHWLTPRYWHRPLDSNKLVLVLETSSAPCRIIPGPIYNWRTRVDLNHHTTIR